MARIAYAQEFSDASGTPYEAAFTYLSNKGVVEGYSNGHGLPNNLLNRAEALKVVAGLRVADRVDWYKKNAVPLPLFRDVATGTWYTPYVEAGFEANILTGYPDQTFRPANYLTVEEAIAMALRAYGETGNSQGAQLSPYIQNRDNEWFTPYINAAVTKNLIMNLGRLELGQYITRGRFFDLLYRLDKVYTEGSVSYGGPEPAQYITAQPRSQIFAVQPSGSINVPQSTSVPAVLPQYASEQYFAVSMPTLSITDLTITHPFDPFTPDGVLQPLQQGVGHLFGYPGGGGKIMIYGHSSSYPWDVSNYSKIFRQANKLSAGDRIYVTYDGKLYTYEVTHKHAVDASDTSQFQDNGSGEELILYTCWPPDSISQRYLVHALPVNVVALR